MSHEHYFIDVSGYERVDVYRLIDQIGRDGLYYPATEEDGA